MRQTGEEERFELPPATPCWPHAPEHRLTEKGVYIVTASTFRKEPMFAGNPRVRLLHDALLDHCARAGWNMEAWAVFPNHYHFVAAASDSAIPLRVLIREFHSRTALALNRGDNTPGRRVWHNYWETRLTNERSYLARLNYVHQNPVRHGLVTVANAYPFGSAAWFERAATSAQVKTVYSFKIDRVLVPDDF